MPEERGFHGDDELMHFAQMHGRPSRPAGLGGAKSLRKWDRLGKLQHEALIPVSTCSKTDNRLEYL